jgi:hypothetical protein
MMKKVQNFEYYENFSLSNIKKDYSKPKKTEKKEDDSE